MVNVDTIVLIVAAILFLLAAANIPSKINLTALGLFFLTLSFLL